MIYEVLWKLIERILKSTFCLEGFENNETVWIFIFFEILIPWSFSHEITLEYKVIIYNPKLITWSIRHMILKSETDLVIMNKTEYTRSKDKRRSENEVIFKQMLVNIVDSSFLRIEVITDDFISFDVLIGQAMKWWHLHYCLYNNQISFRTVPKYVPKMGMRNAKILSSQQLNKQTWPSTRPLWWNFWIFIIKFPLWKANSKLEWYASWTYFFRVTAFETVFSL